ncbi:hypothetical protein ACQKQD_23785 [Methylobacterium sp. NPDC080182]|uniref:hypothetical protein n=1 Tax=Methylobacterium sp. NPDC080182 TaxID=3390590 RepID=UPI003D027CD6
MSNTAAMMGLGEMRRREQAAKARGEKFKSTPEKRAALAAILEKREALMAEQQTAEKAKVEASPDALRAVLSRGTVDELAEIARMIGRLDGRRMQDIVNEVFRERSRTGYVPDDEASQKPAEAPPAAKASSSSRTR